MVMAAEEGDDSLLFQQVPEAIAILWIAAEIVFIEPTPEFDCFRFVSYLSSMEPIGYAVSNDRGPRARCV